jgi:hypothetical protein
MPQLTSLQRVMCSPCENSIASLMFAAMLRCACERVIETEGRRNFNSILVSPSTSSGVCLNATSREYAFLLTIVILLACVWPAPNRALPTQIQQISGPRARSTAFSLSRINTRVCASVDVEERQHKVRHWCKLILVNFCTTCGRARQSTPTLWSQFV